MKTLLIVLSAAVFTKNCCESWQRHVDKFIETSNKTFTVLSIDGAMNETFYTNKVLFNVSIIKLDVSTKVFINCEVLTKLDRYSNVKQTAQLTDFQTMQNFENFMNLWRLNEDFNHIIFTSFDFLRTTLKCLTNPVGRFLFIIGDNSTDSTELNLISLLNETWTNNGALKVFIAINDSVYSFDPFHRNNNGVFGKLNTIFDASLGETVDELNGYALSVEMFSGTFTLPRVKAPKNINDFDGPDAIAANFIGNQLNATCT